MKSKVGQKDRQSARDFSTWNYLGVVIVITFMISSVSLSLFWHSEARSTAVNIQRAFESDVESSFSLGKDHPDIDLNDNVLKPAELYEIQRNICQKLQSLNPKQEFQLCKDLKIKFCEILNCTESPDFTRFTTLVNQRLTK